MLVLTLPHKRGRKIKGLRMMGIVGIVICCRHKKNSLPQPPLIYIARLSPSPLSTYFSKALKNILYWRGDSRIQLSANYPSPSCRARRAWRVKDAFFFSSGGWGMELGRKSNNTPESRPYGLSRILILPGCQEYFREQCRDNAQRHVGVLFSGAWIFDCRSSFRTRT